MNAVALVSRLPGGNAVPSAPARALRIDFVSHTPRRIPVSRSAHIRGYEPIGGGRPAVAFESLLERQFIRALARFPEVRDIASQPLTVHYHYDAVACRYTPDLLVVLHTVPAALETLGFGLRTLIEVKPDARLGMERERLERHGRAIKRACPEPWILLTDSDLARGALEVPHERR